MKCWFCSEEIPTTAQVCPCCGRRQKSVKTAPQPPLQQPLSSTKKHAWINLEPVSKDAVLAKDLSDLDALIKAVSQEIRERGDFTPWTLTISGFVTDPRPLWEIPEVRAWCKDAHAKAPYLPLLLSDAAIGWYALCVLDIEEVERHKQGSETIGIYRVAPEKFKHFYLELSAGTGEFFHGQCGLDLNNETASLLKKCTDRMMRAIKSVIIL